MSIEEPSLFGCIPGKNKTIPVEKEYILVPSSL